MEARYLSKADFARHKNVSRSYVTQLGKQDMLVMQGQMVDVDKTEALLKQQSDPSKQGVKDRHAANRALPPGQPADPGNDLKQLLEKSGLTYQKGRAVNEHYKALSSKMEYEKAVGKLLETEAVTFVAANAAMVLRSRLETMADSLDPQLEAERDPNRRRVIFMDYIENLLTEISREFSSLAKMPDNPQEMGEY